MEKPSGAFVKTVNRLYHQEEAAVYDTAHPEIFQNERTHWERLAHFLPHPSAGRVLLDVGSGTGFVVASLLPHLTCWAKVILTDSAPEMLHLAEQKFRGVTTPVMQYTVADAEALPLPDVSVDAVTLNSVLHHLPNTGVLFREIDRVLKPGGRVCIAHEPNRAFYANGMLQGIVWMLTKAQAVRIRLGRLLHRKPPSRSHDVYAAMVARVNAELRRRHLTDRNLSDEEIQSCVDVYSPTATRIPDRTKGFLVDNIMRQYLPAYRVCYRDTYAHVGKIDAQRGPFVWLCDRVLRWLFPLHGSSFSLVAEKRETSHS